MTDRSKIKKCERGDVAIPKRPCDYIFHPYRHTSSFRQKDHSAIWFAERVFVDFGADGTTVKNTGMFTVGEDKNLYTTMAESEFESGCPYVPVIREAYEDWVIEGILLGGKND